VDWARAICVVSPADHARATRWSGGPQHLDYELCQAIRAVLVGDDDDPVWSKRMKELIASQRAEHSFLRDEPSPILQKSDELTWWTYAGGRANILLAKMIEAELGGTVTARNESLTMKGEAGASIVRVAQFLDELAVAGRPSDEDAIALAPSAARGKLSKFEPCLPPAQLARLQTLGCIDAEGARRVLAQRRR